MPDADIDHIRDGIHKVLAEADDGPYLIGDVLVIAEITPIDGETNLLTMHNKDISHWKELGFLHDRIHSINSGNFSLGAAEDDDDA
jgi:hypothetical protein